MKKFERKLLFLLLLTGAEQVWGSIYVVNSYSKWGETNKGGEYGGTELSYVYHPNTDNSVALIRGFKGGGGEYIYIPNFTEWDEDAVPAVIIQHAFDTFAPHISGREEANKKLKKVEFSKENSGHGGHAETFNSGNEAWKLDGGYQGMRVLCDYAFYNSSIESIKFNGYEYVIGDYCFSGCSSLKEISTQKNDVNGALPDLSWYLGKYAFEKCSSLTTLSFPSIKSIPEGVCQYCSGLKTVTIDSATSIGSSAFQGCSEMNLIKFSGYEETLGDFAFAECGKLKNVNTFSNTEVGSLPNKLKEINYCLFRNCTSLEKIIIPANVTEIDAGAFHGCTNLTSIKILGSASTIHIYKNGEKGTDVREHNDEDAFDCKDGLNFYIGGIWYQIISQKDGTVRITDGKDWVGRGNNRVGELPSTVKFIYDYKVTEIGNAAFKGCTSLDSISIPSEVTSIGSSAFQGCFNVTKIKIPVGVTSIGSSAFQGCTSLTKIDIPSGVTSIGKNAFYSCHILRTISIPSTVESIGLNAFYDTYNYAPFNGYKIYIEDLAKWCETQFDGYSSNPIYAGSWHRSSKAEVYFNNKPVTKMVIPDSVTRVSSYAFYRFKGLTSVVLPSTLANIDSYAFCTETDAGVASDFSNVVSLRREPATLGTTSPFWSKKGDFSLYVLDSASVNSYKSSSWAKYFNNGNNILALFPGYQTAFRVDSIWYGIKTSGSKECEVLPYPQQLKNYGDPEGVDYSILAKNNNGEITIPKNVEYKGNRYAVVSIADGAFQSCSELKTLVLNGVKVVGNKAFYSCVGLQVIHVPSSLEIVKENAFSQCYNIVGVYITDLKEWCKISFAKNANPLYVGGWWYRSKSPNRTVENKDVLLYVDNNELKKLVIPNGLDSIKGGTFQEYHTLEEIMIPSSVEYIGDKAFEFCSGLKLVYSLNRTPITPVAGVWDSISVDAVLCVRDRNAVMRYRNAGWNSYFNSGNNIKPIDERKGLMDRFESEGDDGNYLFYHITGDGICEVCPIPDTIWKFEKAYEYTKEHYQNSLKSPLEIPTSVRDELNGKSYSVKGIADSTFENCTQLQDISLPSTLDTIKAGAFLGCTGMASVDISSLSQWVKVGKADSASCPANASQKETKLLENDRQLTSIEFSDSIIKGYSFFNFRTLEEITFLPTVDSIGAGAFWKAGKIEEKNYSPTKVNVYSYKPTRLTVDTLGDGGLKDTSSNSFSCEFNKVLNDEVIDTVKTEGKNVCLYTPDDSYHEKYEKNSWNKFFFILPLVTLDNCFPNGIVSTSGDKDKVFWFQVIKKYEGQDKMGTCRLILPNTSNTAYKESNIKIPNIAVDKYHSDVPSSYYVVEIGANVFYNNSNITEVNLPDSKTDGSNGGGIQRIASTAFSNCSNLKKINIPITLDTIGMRAFYGCDKLDSLSFPVNGNLKYIGSEAFRNVPMKGTDTLKFSSSLSYVGEYAFEGNQGLKSITVPSDNKGKRVVIGMGAFNRCDSLQEINLQTMSNPAETGTDAIVLGDSAFANNDSLKKVTLGSNVKLSGTKIFKGCTALDSVYLPSNLTLLGNQAFEGCSNLSVVRMDNLSTIGVEAFLNCKNLEKVQIKDLSSWCQISFSDDFSNPLTAGGIYEKEGFGKRIGLYEKDKNDTIKDIVIPRNVTNVASRAFKNYPRLKSITIPNSVKGIGAEAFANTTNLDSVLCFSHDPLMLGGNVFRDTFSTSRTTEAKLYVRDRVAKYNYDNERSWSSAFSSLGEDENGGQKAIKNLSDTAENKVFELDSIFYKITGDNSCEVVRKNAILEKEEGKYKGDVELPFKAQDLSDGKSYTLKSVGDSAFYKCTGLSSILLPDSVETIGTGAFLCNDGNTKSGLKKVTSLASAPPMLNVAVNQTFGALGDVLDTLYVRDRTTKKLYEAKSEQGTTNKKNWGDWFNDGRNSTGSRVVSISNADFQKDGIYYSLYDANGDRVFVTYCLGDGKDYTGKIFIPDSFEYNQQIYHVKAIGDSVFINSRSLKEVSIPHSVDTIGMRAFYRCDSLENLICWAKPVPVIKDMDSLFYALRYPVLYVENLAYVDKYSNDEDWGKYFWGVKAMGNYHFIKNDVCYYISNDDGKEVYVARPVDTTFYTGKRLYVKEEVVNDSSEYDLDNTKTTYGVVGVMDSAFVRSDSVPYLELPKTIQDWGKGCFFNTCFDTLISLHPAPDTIKHHASPDTLFNVKSKVLGVRDGLSKIWHSDSIHWSKYFEDNGVIRVWACDIASPDGLFYNFNNEDKTTLKLIADPNGSKYKGTIDLKNEVEYPEGRGNIFTLTEIDSVAFKGCKELKSLTIRDSVQKIGQNAFIACDDKVFKDFFIEDVDHWATKAFANEFSNPMQFTHRFQVIDSRRVVTDLSLSAPKVTSYAFQGCNSLNRVIFQPSVKTIENNAFRGCDEIQEVYCLHTNYDDIPTLGTEAETDHFSHKLYDFSKLYILDEIWKEGKEKRWDTYFDKFNSVSIYGGEGKEEIKPRSVVVYSSKGSINVLGATKVRVVDLSGASVVDCAANGMWTSIPMKAGNYITIVEGNGETRSVKVQVEE